MSTCTLRLLRGLVQGGGLIAQVESMHTSPDVRGQGVGTAMMTWVIEEATRRGCVRVELTSDASRRDAHRFYQSLGFVGTHLGMKLRLQ